MSPPAPHDEPTHRDEVRPWRLLLALGIGCACWWAGHGLPFAAAAPGQPPNGPAACRLLFVVGLTTSTWLLSALPIAAASLLPLALLPMLGVQSTAALTAGYGHPILWLFGGGFVLAQAVERCGLHRRLALRLTARLGPYPRRLVLGFCLAATLSSMWISNTAIALLLLPIGMVVVRRAAELGDLDPRAQRNFGGAIMCAIAFGATIGGMGTPIGTAPNALFFSAYEPLEKAGHEPVSFLLWVAGFAPYSLLLSVGCAFVLSRIAMPLPKARLSHGDELLREAHELPRWSTAERRTGALFAAAVLLWTTRADIPLGGGDALHGWAHWLVPAGARDTFVADGSVAVLVAIAAFVIPTGERARPRLVDWETARQMPFDLLLLLGSGIAMAQAFGPTGLSAAFGELLKPLIGSMHPMLLVFLVICTVSALSEVASNTAIATLLLPIVREGALAAGIDPLVLMLPVVIGASCSFMLPIATPPNTIVFASRQLGFGQMARAGVGLNILSAVLMLPVLWYWALPLLGVDTTALLGGGR
ncbi:MAG: SLC13/DASS family transporter [Planctomycetes bacterium]|nr:SLC13/DASS family transporter [Planctomycetota bacterium]